MARKAKALAPPKETPPPKPARRVEREVKPLAVQLSAEQISERSSQLVDETLEAGRLEATAATATKQAKEIRARIRAATAELIAGTAEADVEIRTVWDFDAGTCVTTRLDTDEVVETRELRWFERQPGFFDQDDGDDESEGTGEGQQDPNEEDEW